MLSALPEQAILDQSRRFSTHSRRLKADSAFSVLDCTVACCPPQRAELGCPFFFGCSYQCLLGQDYMSSSLCTYTFVVCGVSLVVSAVISMIQCCTCNLCGLGKILDVLVSFHVRGEPPCGCIAGHACQSPVSTASTDWLAPLDCACLQLGALGTIWWAVASGVIGSNAMDPLGGTAQVTASSSVNTARDAVPIMCWVETGIFGAMLLSSLFRVCNCCSRS